MVRPEIKKKRQKAALEAHLSHKARKKLEKVVLRKKLKTDKNVLLSELKQCQLEPEVLARLHSTSSMQTKGKKKFLNDSNVPNFMDLKDAATREQNLDAVLNRKWVKRKRTVSSSSSSEDTDALSSDTEIYEPPVRNQDKKPAPSSPQPDVKPDLKTQIVETEAQSKIDEPTKFADSKPVVKEPAIFVNVIRDSVLQKCRLKLPIIGEEQMIMETVRYSDIVVLSGETGSGKTTQVPQFLYEAGYALQGKLIGITEPRRVAAISMSERVGKELGLSNQEVSYQIRFSGNVSPETKIKFMTDGVLLRECQHDFLLSRYSVIIIDEAHERSIFSDILIGLLSRIVPMRAKRGNPLKLIIMSATLRTSDFTENAFLFHQPPPVIKVDARQFPVNVHFAKRTPDNYLQAAYRKVCAIHSKMPKGGILVFVTSQMDVKTLCKRLRQKFPQVVTNKSASTKFSRVKTPRQNAIKHAGANDKIIMDNLKQELEIESDEEQLENDPDQFTGRDMKWSDQDSDSDDEEGTLSESSCPLHCLGLYAMLPIEKQKAVFKAPPEGSRLCVISTNVAETSITIPNIRFVVDTGLEKTRVYESSGISRFVTTWTSKSSAEQRKGRAGRMGPGSCYRLYSSAVFCNDFLEHSEPKILQKPVEDVVLQMKAMNIDNVVNFPFPSRPSIDALMAAEKKLVSLGALDDTDFKQARFADINKTEFASKPTPLGRAMARFSVGARCSKMIVLSPTDLLGHVISLVATMSVREMFLEGDKYKEIRKSWSGHGQSKLLGDFMVMLRAIIETDASGYSSKFCNQNGLRVKAMLEIDKLRRQLIQEVNKNLETPLLKLNEVLKKPTEAQSRELRQLVYSAHSDHIATKILDNKNLKHAYETKETEDPVYICLKSVLKGRDPDYIAYRELHRTTKKIYMRDLCAIDPNWTCLDNQ